MQNEQTYKLAKFSQFFCILGERSIIQYFFYAYLSVRKRKRMQFFEFFRKQTIDQRLCLYLATTSLKIKYISAGLSKLLMNALLQAGLKIFKHICTIKFLSDALM